MSERTSDDAAERDPGLAGTTIGAFLEALGSRTPTPGGGAVAALTAALGAALGRMVLAYSRGRTALAAHAGVHEEATRALRRLEARSLDLARADEEAYGRLNTLWKLDREDGERRRAMPAAVRDAIGVPREALDACGEMLDVLAGLVDRTNSRLASDLAIAAVLAEAAARAAAWNVRVNLPLIEDASESARIEAEVTSALGRAAERCASIEAGCRAPR